ncbi:PAQR family membrane homeostasis protein TrhA [Paracoccus homiensis]|uniref:PAQR family membrane homeostasis protein TrhA n=1 Tax=Paracoccus homiensis TaxID=364199 RepID=UPI00398D2987
MSANFKFGRAYDFHEMLADGIVHAIGVVLALIGATALIFYATVYSDHAQVAAACIYGVGLVGSLGISFAYNMLPHSRFKWHMRRLDHSAIFFLIAATYTPFLQAGAHHPRVLGLLIAIWVIACLGIAVKCLLPGRYDRLAVILYLLLGWSGLVAIGPMATYLPASSLILIVIGGVIYSAGVVFHLWEKLRFQNAIWHGFVVTAAAVHYSAVFLAFRV